MKLRLLPAAWAAAAFLTAPALAGNVHLVPIRQLESTSTFELRFDEMMIPPEEVGRTAETPPVVFRPAVKGSFVWLSQRSGTFKPEEPLALSTTYLLSVPPGIKKADGRPLIADFRESIKTPPMQLKGWNAPRGLEKDNASAEPRFSLLFNANVDAAAAGPFIQYVSHDGERVDARVARLTPSANAEQYFPAWRSSDHSLLTWTERFYERSGTENGLEARRASQAGANQLWIVPVHALSPGDWRLVVAAGLPATEGNLHLLDPTEIEIGKVLAFEVNNAEASNLLESGRKLTLTFSKPLGKDVTDKNVGRWVRVEPEPDNLAVKCESWNIVMSGDFDLDKKYRVTVDAGLPSSEPFVLATEFRQEVEFSQVPARLYFEEFSTHQLSTGSRQFHLLAINVPKVRVSARVFAPEAAALALNAYREYLSPQHQVDDEPYQRLDLDKLPGQTVWQQELPIKSDLDEKKEVALDWNEILGAGKTGIVLLTAEQPEKSPTRSVRPGVQALVQVTDLGVVWKESADEIFAHVFSLATGKAVAGVKLSTLDDDGNALNETVTDATGVARLKTEKDVNWILATNGADTHLVDFRDGAEELSLRRLGIREAAGESDPDDARQALIFTERSVYKPGDTVHLKGIVRDWRDGHAHIPTGAKVTLTFNDPQDRLLLNRTVTISDAGSFSEDLKLPASGLGTYHAGLKMVEDGDDASDIATHDVEVQEYTPNAFEIKIAPAPQAIGDTKLELPVTAQYYMGKALSKAQMTWSLDASDNGFTPAGFESYAFCDAVEDSELSDKLGRLSHFSDQGKAELDAQGGAKVATAIPLNPKAPQPRSAHLLCEITDVDQQTVSQSSDFTIHSSDFYLGIRQPRDVVHEGETLPVDVVAVRTDGTPTLEPVDATLRLKRIEWQNNRVETAGGGTEYRNQAHIDLVSQAEIKTRKLVKSNDKWALSSEEKSTPLIAGKPGQYLLEAVSKDAEGREVITTTAFNVYGEGETGWDYRNPFQIELAADKEEYLSGQTAKVLVKTPIAGEALVTVERDKVIRSFVTQLSGNAPVVEVPLVEADAPNVFVSVMMLRGAADSPKKFKAPEYRVGYCKLKVARPDAKLMVYVKPDAPSYRPGDQVNVGAQVLDSAGHPVANAEVTLYAVDEGVLSLMGYETPDPFTFFNQERALAVTTGLTLPTLMPEDPDDRTFGNKGYLVGGGGDDSNDALRKNFIACALWNGSMKTDAEGRISASFQAPDSLTRYRVMAVVQTARDQFGSGESSFEVNKPVMIEPALPRFANVGDKLILRGVLHNMTDAEGQVDVRVEFDGTVSTPAEARKITLPARGSVAVDIPVTFIQAGSATWKWSAHFSGGGLAYRDAVQTTLNVGYPVPVKRELRFTEMHGDESNLLAGMNPELLEGAGAIHVSFTNSRLLELREALDGVLHYPYGCVEQTTSSTLPWVAMRDFRNVLPALKRSDEEIKAAVNHGMDRLLSMQTSSGGLAYWPGESEPMFWGSAYGGLGMAMAKRAGFVVPEEAFDRLCNYLSEQLRGSNGEGFDQHYQVGGPSDRCLALYTLAVAGKAEPAYHEVLFKKRQQLSAENRALLALAIAESDGPAAMIAELLNPKQERLEPEDDWFWSASRETAMRLLAWCRSQPDSPQVGRLVQELLDRRQHGQWLTTQGNCWSLLALGDYFRRVEKPDTEIAATVAWNGKPEAVALNKDEPFKTVDFTLSKDAAAKPMRLANPEKKKVFAEVLIESRPQTIAQPRQDQGYSIRRTYAKVEDDNTLSDLKEPHVGDRVLVTLNIDVHRPAHYVVVDDPLPANFEAINPAFKSQETRAGERLGRPWTIDYQELRDDRALFFANEIAEGEYTIRYLARVKAAGTATAPSSKVEEMYHPERFGLTETMQVTTLPLK